MRYTLKENVSNAASYMIGSTEVQHVQLYTTIIVCTNSKLVVCGGAGEREGEFGMGVEWK